MKRLFKTKKSRAIFGVGGGTLLVLSLVLVVGMLFQGTFAKMTFTKKVENITATAGNVELNAILVKPGTNTPFTDADKKDLFENLYSGYGDPDYVDPSDLRFDVDVIVTSTGTLNPDFNLYFSGDFMTHDPIMAIDKCIRVRAIPIESESGIKLESKTGANGVTLEDMIKGKEMHNDTKDTQVPYYPICYGELKSKDAQVGDKRSRIRLHFSVDDIDKGVYDFANISDWSENSLDNQAQGQTTKFDFVVKAMANPRHQEKATGTDPVATP